MASVLQCAGSAVASKTRFAPSPRARGTSTRVIVRAGKDEAATSESTSVAKVVLLGSSAHGVTELDAFQVDRSKDFLFFADERSLAYLDGTLPGDAGFDPFGLLEPGSADVGFINPSWLRYAEVIHGRFAMLGVAGCLAPETLGMIGVIPKETAVIWWQSGVFPFAGSYDNYFASPYTIFFIQVVLMQFAELRRLQDFRKPGSMGKQYFLGLENFLGGSGDPSYPGGLLFNPFGFGKDEASMNDLKLKEIKNGRLAMMASFGFGAQAVLTHKGPVQNLFDHIADPFGNNILTNFGHVYGS